MGRFQSNRVIITGAASGIGRAAALAFAAEGAELGLIDGDSEKLTQTASELGLKATPPRLAPIRLGDEASARSTLSKLGFDRVDVLVNCAGIDLAASLTDSAEKDVQDIFAVNMMAPLFLCKHVVPLMREGGAIVNVASAAGLVPISGRPAYVASKGALIAFTRALALDLAPRIRANCVCPGAIDTPLLQSSIKSAADAEQAMRSVVDRYPLKRLGEADEIARAILFLASSEARYITGTALPVDGGRTFH